jgi:tRNA A37 threonylcarbamoyladenosine dehydratase
MNDYAARFAGVGRLYSMEGLARLRTAHVCVVGIGGVGSWVVEALARSGVGQLTLVDLDEVCLSNVNRQLHALDGEIGKAKVEVMAQRAQAINPECQIHPRLEFFLESNAAEILNGPYHYVVDAIDAISKKALLIATCRQRKLRVLTIGAAGGRTDPTAVEVDDLAFTSDDGLLRNLRKDLRKKFGFPKEGIEPFGVDCVFSTEAPVYPRSDGTVCTIREPESKLRINCDNGYGTASFVTGTFGFVAAARVVRELAHPKMQERNTE